MTDTDAERDERMRGIQERAEAAQAVTRGLPWVVDPDEPAYVLASKNGGHDGQIVATIQADDYGLVERSVTTFIAAARTDVPWLLVEVARLERLLHEHRI